MNNRVMCVAMCAALAMTLAVPAGAADDVSGARQVMKNYAKAVVQIEAVLSISAEGPMAGRVGAQEKKVRILGTVIDESGLTVVSYMSLDPTSTMKNFKVPGQQVTMSIKGELSDVNIVLQDGTEIPARVVLKDEDLDMAFIIPKDKLEKEAAEQIQAVDLTKASAKAGRLDRVVRLGRLSKELNRELIIKLDRVAAIITKPRTFYILSGAQPGAPVFTADGKLLGILLIHKKPGSSRAGATPVVLPAKDVKKIADQAAEELAKDDDKDTDKDKDTDTDKETGTETDTDDDK